MENQAKVKTSDVINNSSPFLSVKAIFGTSSSLVVTVKSQKIFGGNKELYFSCYDLEWLFLNIDNQPEGLQILKMWGIPFTIEQA